jgi:uroporphyrinogen decarboxylase
VEFEKNFGPRLGEIDLENISNINEINFTKKISEVYEAISKTSRDPIMNNRDMIGFVGAPWTILVYMINRSSPKKGLSNEFFQDESLIKKLLFIIEKYLKLHIKNQIEAGAKVIQIFDSWAGLLKDKIPEYIYIPTSNIVEYTKKLGVPVICFPRGIKDYKKFCESVKPDAINIDYDVDPKKIVSEIKIPIQGGLDPKILLTDKENLKKEVGKYLNIFKDHPYVFNLGHGILPETKIEMVENLIKIVRDFK